MKKVQSKVKKWTNSGLRLRHRTFVFSPLLSDFETTLLLAVRLVKSNAIFLVFYTSSDKDAPQIASLALTFDVLQIGVVSLCIDASPHHFLKFKLIC